MTKNDRKRKPKSKVNRFVAFLRPRFFMDERYQRYLLLVLLALVLTFIIIPKGGFIPGYYAPGDIASRDIKAPKDLLIPDLSLTEKKRLEAEDAILPLYDFDPRTGKDIADRLMQAIKLLHNELKKAASSENLQKDTESLLGISLSDQELEILGEIPITENVLGPLRQVVVKALNAKIVGNLELFQAERERGIIVRNLASQTETAGTDLESVIGLDEAQDRIELQMKQFSSVSDHHRQVLFFVIQKLLRFLQGQIVAGVSVGPFAKRHLFPKFLRLCNVRSGPSGQRLHLLIYRSPCAFNGPLQFWAAPRKLLKLDT